MIASAKRFVLLAVPRTGSNMLCTMLNEHSEILCHHELFNPKGIRYALHLRDSDFDLGNMGFRDDSPEKFIQDVWENPMGAKAIGFKMTYKQHEAAFDYLLKDRNCKKVLLRRRNRIKTFVSHLISERLGEWEVYEKKRLRKDRSKVEVDPEALADRARRDDQYFCDINDHLQADDQTSFEIWYEDLVNGKPIDELLDFLEVGRVDQPLVACSIKQNSNDLQNLVANFEDLKMQLKGTEFESELYSES